MKIKLNPEQEGIVRAELESGRFRTPEEVIAHAFEALRQKEEELAMRAGDAVQRDGVREMLAFVERNRVRLQGVSVKELIHEGHRL